MTNKNLTIRSEVSASVQSAVDMWAKATKDSDRERFADMVRDKSNAVVDFYQVIGTAPQTASPGDMERWLEDMCEPGVASSTVYARSSFVSSFYSWLQTNEQLADALPYGNIASQVKTKPPKAHKC